MKYQVYFHYLEESSMSKQWKNCMLGEALQFQRGFDLPATMRKEGSYPVVSSSGGCDRHNEYKAIDPGVVVGRSGTIGSIFYIEENFWPLNTVLWVKDFYNNYPHFIYYFLKILDLGKYNAGSGVPTLNRNHIHLLEISLPPLPIQRKIGHILSRLDAKIELNNKINANLEAQAQALYRHYFVDNSKKEWKSVSLGESTLSSILSSGIEEFEGEKIYLATADIQGITVVNSKVKVSYNNRPSRANMQPVEYSVWFAKKGGVSKKQMFVKGDSRISKVILSTGFSGLKTTKLSHYYIWCYILSSTFDEVKETYLSGSVQPDINNEGIKSITILEPDEETLSIFTTLVHPLFSMILDNALENDVLSQLRDTLLPKLMSGEIDVSDITIPEN